MNLIGKETNKDIIMRYLKDPEGIEEKDLTRKQRDLLNWYVDAYTLIRNYSSVPDTIQVLTKLGRQRGTPISMPTARRYIYDALDLFGAVSVMKADAINHLAIEMFQDAAAMARDQNNPAVLIAAGKAIREAGGQEDPNAINREMIEQHIIQIMLDPAGQKAVRAITGKGVVDLDILMNNTDAFNVDEADYEILKNDSSED